MFVISTFFRNSDISVESTTEANIFQLSGVVDSLRLQTFSNYEIGREEDVLALRTSNSLVANS